LTEEVLELELKCLPPALQIFDHAAMDTVLSVGPLVGLEPGDPVLEVGDTY
jgi:hypothetical protein